MIKKIYNYFKNLYLSYHYLTFSQCGEDVIIRFLFNSYGKNRINYLDIGTNNPKFGNNTYLFYRNKSKGICVEANPYLINEIKYYRKKDIILNYGVSSNSSEKNIYFHIFNDSQINTFNPKEASQRLNSNKYYLVDKIQVPLITINEILTNYFKITPELLSIDIEGLDFDVLKTLNFEKFPIPVICVETCQYSENHIHSKNTTLINFMLSKNYQIYADTYINTIFVNKEWLYNNQFNK
jgi:hypothetical protein